MRKVVAVVAFCLLAGSSLVLATEAMDAIILDRPIPERVSRDGACTVSAWPDTANSIGIWGATTFGLNAAHAMYIDPSMDEYITGDCSAPFYPFHLATVELDFIEMSDDTMNVGNTFTYQVTIACAKDGPSGTVTPDCQGPGATIATYTMSHTLTREDFDEEGFGNWIIINLPVDVCVSGPFFLIAQFTGWNGTGDAPQLPWHYHGAAVTNATERCDNWISLPGALGYGCWLLNGYDIGYGCAAPPPGFAACFPGAALMFVNGHAGMGCAPVACTPLPNNYPGDDASNPIVVNTSPWSSVIDLCQFTSDYNYYDDAGAAPTTSRRFTGRGNDAVLRIEFDPNMIEACFAVTITPQCQAPNILRLRTWLYDESYDYTLSWGNPQYPATGAQSYNFTDPCEIASSYLLFIDGYPCCCPVSVSYSGDTPLPVELADFGAVAGDGEVALTWVTRAEMSIDRWEITRNGMLLASVGGLGDNATGHTYNYVDRDVANGTTYVYSLTAYGFDGSATVFPRTAAATPAAGVPTEYALHQNYPNPFNPATSISYAVKDAGLVTLKVYTIDGREVATLVNAVQPGGSYTVGFSGSDLASGVYLYKLDVNGFSATQKMVLMK